MNLVELEELAREIGAIKDKTHVILPSGKHTNGYFSQRPIGLAKETQGLFAAALASLMLDFECREGIKIHILVGSMTEGGIWGELIRSSLWQINPNREIRSIITRGIGTNPQFVIEAETGRDDTTLLADKTVLLINEVVSTGQSIEPLRNLIIAAGGNPVAVLTLCDRRTSAPEQNRPIWFGLFAKIMPSGWKRVATAIFNRETKVSKHPDLVILSLFTKRNWDTWKRNECPLCLNKMPIVSNLTMSKRL